MAQMSRPYPQRPDSPRPASPRPASPRLAVRALILDAQGRLLLVNAWAGDRSNLWAAPGGGVMRGEALPLALAREVAEETGLQIAVGAPALVNEFHDPQTGFHQVEVFFRATITAGLVSDDWRDPEGVVSRRRWVSRPEMATIRFKPGLLAEAAWGEAGMLYDPLEVIVR